MTDVSLSDAAMIRTIREQIVDRLRIDVLSGRLVEGEALRESKLAERFGVSRGPVRDALLQLSKEGLLVSRPHCGVKVAGPMADSVLPLILSMRRMVEGYALTLVFKQIPEQDFRRWEGILDQLRSACVEGDYPRIVEHDMALHRSIVDRAGQPELVELWASLVNRMRIAYSRYYTDPMEIHREHVAIIDAIRSGHCDAAVRALEENIR